MEIINLMLHIFGSIFNTTCYNLSYAKINNKKLNINRKNLLIIILVGTIMLVNNSYTNLWIKFLLTTVVYSINYKIIFKDNIKNILISHIIIDIVIIIIEIIETNLLLNIGIIKSSNGATFYTYTKFFLSILIPTTEYMLFSIRIINNFIKKLLNIFIKNLNSLNIAYLICITFYSLGVLNFENFAAKGSIKLIILLFLIFSILFAIIIKSKYKEDDLKATNKRLKDYNEKYGLFLDEYKIYKHNIKNKLIAIKAFGNKKVKQLIDDLLEEETTFSVKNSNLYNLPNGIKGIVAEKLYNPQIDVIIDNKLKDDPFMKLKPKVFNKVSESIGICIDNAIEASIATEEPVITIDLYEDKKYFYIKIGNSYCNEIDIDKLGDKYYSTKNRGSGLGLFSIMRNKAVHERITIINDFFYIELQIKKAR